MIDKAFIDLVTARLALLPFTLSKSDKDIVYDTTQGFFPFVRDEFGTERASHLDVYSIRIAGLPDDFNSSEAGIREGKMCFRP